MNEKQKTFILFTLSILIWLGVLTFVLLLALKIIDIDGTWGALISLVTSPLLSQLFGLWPKVIHYKKVDKRVKEVEKLKREAEELKKKNVVNRDRLF